MDIQPDANVEDQDRAKCGKNEAGGMASSGCRVRKHVGNRAADDRSDDAEHDCPENVMYTCITDFAITPAINPTTMYQIK